LDGSRTASDILFAGQGAMQRKIEELIETYGSMGGQTIGELKWNRPTPHNSNHRSR
jgi:hypothetical protein